MNGLGHEAEEALQEISRCSKRIGACLPCMPWLHSKLIHCRNERPFSVDNFSFGVASNLFMVHAVQSLQFSVIMCNLTFCGLVQGMFFVCVATKDIHVDPFSSLSLRVFLPDTFVTSGLPAPMITAAICLPQVTFTGPKVACDAAVSRRLAPETMYPGAFEDGFKVLNWFAKQSNLASCGRLGAQSHIFDSCGASMVEPWLAAHGDTSGYPFGLTCLSCSSGI
ncbi:hypothetical protein NC653_015598 [Populus alba x Populus x berolinensis]|nr:hypothetical protein NC653_015598 [Populus alba x Populus x berolinensis]